VVTGQSQGQAFQAVVKKIDKTEITLDFNHPLAGKTLNFDIEIMDVK
jgi:FKBP-type peptidyl-prolyl cis-trans isomerase SlpA